VIVWRGPFSIVIGGGSVVGEDLGRVLCVCVWERERERES